MWTERLKKNSEWHVNGYGVKWQEEGFYRTMETQDVFTSMPTNLLLSKLSKGNSSEVSLLYI